ncbi:TPA: fructose-6-phosphate aldolase [candidate division WOR-3 bacterium]|jgi:transaldolase|uniref:Probable transaldolase n=1 Tax=candidate division WOR-3 bacterium TaxID=2052148 RepID=A0A350H9R9_UNCW3|nr:fructose-6-phosphate aldolase [candidate division WOR-3 bacterium]
MKFFIDTANIEEIKKANSIGLLDGVTTNPTLIAKEIERTKRKPADILAEICSIVKGPVSGEVIALDYENMVKEAMELHKIASNIAVKIPMTEDGLRAVRTLSEKDIMTNVTLIFTPVQAVLAAKAGATFTSPFIGRLDDISQEGINIVEDIHTIFENYGYPTEIIVASVRNPVHVLQSLLIGADIATIPYSVIMQLIKHPLTESGIKRFLDDYKKAQENL